MQGILIESCLPRLPPVIAGDAGAARVTPLRSNFVCLLEGPGLQGGLAAFRFLLRSQIPPLELLEGPGLQGRPTTT